MVISVRPSALLAEGECLVVSAVLDTDRIPVLGHVREAVLRAFIDRDDDLIEGLSVKDKILAYTMIYGGLVLSYKCDIVTPISRIHVGTLLELGVRSEERIVSDSLILRAWALIFKGREAEGLDLLSGEIIYPTRLGWRVGGDVRIAPIGVEVIRGQPTHL
ncbi:MAG: hypothetical protein QXE99_03855 [Acidilobaceae archaeon]